MEHLLLFSVIFLCLRASLSNEQICDETRHVSSKEGGEVMFSITQTDVQDITWMTDRDKSIFAVTEPGKPVTIRSQLYSGRIKVTAYGSLIITNLTREDQGTYKGSVLRRTSGQCAQFYNLTLHGLTNENICGETRHISSEVGGEVKFFIKQMEVQDITWMTDTDKNIFAVTKPGKPVTIRSQLYNGRINVTASGSLIITKLTREDRGIYKGSVLRRTSGQCAQFYNLTLYENKYLEEEISMFSNTPTTSSVGGSTGAKTAKERQQSTAWIRIILCVSTTAALVMIFIITIVVSKLQTVPSRKENLLYCNLDMKHLQRGPPARIVVEETTVTYSYLKTKTSSV
ncbi:uncharacterized protein LOC143769492 isoform X1 [Ranitomeya variabilis]|uniref:uncharacterized protein LOC143769492 isoform X1 n=1 Tax=Ranitomeya variabilis TaxID=490064 RepID=UPI004055AA62